MRVPQSIFIPHVVSVKDFRPHRHRRFRGCNGVSIPAGPEKITSRSIEAKEYKGAQEIQETFCHFSLTCENKNGKENFGLRLLIKIWYG